MSFGVCLSTIDSLKIGAKCQPKAGFDHICVGSYGHDRSNHDHLVHLVRTRRRKAAGRILFDKLLSVSRKKEASPCKERFVCADTTVEDASIDEDAVRGMKQSFPLMVQRRANRGPTQISVAHDKNNIVISTTGSPRPLEP